MGAGTSSGVITPKQPGVIQREGENFPIISEDLLKLTPEQLQGKIDQLGRVLESNRGRMIPDVDLEKNLSEARVVREFAKTAVERRG